MSRQTCFQAGLIASVMLAAPAWAGDGDDMIKQLLPAPQQPAAATGTEAPVLSVAAATKDEIVGRLGSDLLSRSIDPKTHAARSVVLAPGHEAETLAVFHALPSMQVAVAFQGSSDALASESGALLGKLADALNDKRLASYRFVIGVHTDSVGSDDYNLSLANLRAKAIVDQLVTAHGLSKGRLFAIGFGRISDGATGTATPGQRIRVVNLGDTVVLHAAPVVAVVPHVVAAKPVRPVVHTKISQPTIVHVAHRHVRPAWTLAVESVRARPKHPVAWARYPHGYGRVGRSVNGFSDATEGRAGGIDGQVSATWAGYNPGWSGSGRGSGAGAGSSSGGASSSSGSSSSGSSSSGSSSSSGGSTGGAGGASASGGASAAGGASASSGASGGTGGAAGAGGGAGGGHSGGWSDRRLKRQIRRIGTSASGLAIYSFQYIWGGPVMVGVMAQDLLETRPDAVLVGLGGFFQVDYSKLDVRMMPLTEWVRQPIPAAL